MLGSAPKFNLRSGEAPGQPRSEFTQVLSSSTALELRGGRDHTPGKGKAPTGHCISNCLFNPHSQSEGAEAKSAHFRTSSEPVLRLPAPSKPGLARWFSVNVHRGDIGGKSRTPVVLCSGSPALAPAPHHPRGSPAGPHL